jgi:hypothetical protein
VVLAPNRVYDLYLELMTNMCRGLDPMISSGHDLTYPSRVEGLESTSLGSRPLVTMLNSPSTPPPASVPFQTAWKLVSGLLTSLAGRFPSLLMVNRRVCETAFSSAPGPLSLGDLITTVWTRSIRM